MLLIVICFDYIIDSPLFSCGRLEDNNLYFLHVLNINLSHEIFRIEILNIVNTYNLLKGYCSICNTDNKHLFSLVYFEGKILEGYKFLIYSWFFVDICEKWYFYYCYHWPFICCVLQMFLGTISIFKGEDGLSYWT